MGEEAIHRTTLYIPKSQWQILKRRGLNISRLIRSYLDIIIKEDELELIEREIQQLKKKLQELEAKKAYLLQQREKERYKQSVILEKARKFAEFLNNIFRDHPYDLQQQLLTTRILEYIQEEFSIVVSVEHIIKLQQKAKANSGKIYLEDVLPFFEKLKVARNEVIKLQH